MVTGGALVVISSGLHFHLWETTYRHVPTIGMLFLLQALTGLLLGLALVGRRRDVLATAGAGFMASSIGGLLLATTSLGLFGFRESLAAPFAGLLLAIEVAGLLILAPGVVVFARREFAPHRKESQTRRRTVASDLGTGRRSPFGTL